MHSVIGDIMNFAAVFEKYHLIFRHSHGQDGYELLVASELEGLFYLVRSLYDQLQAIIKAIWTNTLLFDRSTKKHELPDSFRRVVLRGQPPNPRSPDEIAEHFGLPKDIARFYADEVAFFRLCKDLRESVAHHGKSLADQPIFRMENGFAVDVTRRPYSAFACWPDGSLQNTRLGCLRCLLAHIVQHALLATLHYVDALRSCIQLPPPVVPDWHPFVRHPLMHHVHRLDKYVQEPWLTDAPRRKSLWVVRCICRALTCFTARGII